MAFSSIIPNPEEVQRQRGQIMTPRGVDPGESILQAIMNFTLGSNYSLFGGQIADQLMAPVPNAAETVQQEAAKYLQGGRPDIAKVLTGYPKSDWMLANMAGAAQVMMPGGTPMMRANVPKVQTGQEVAKKLGLEYKGEANGLHYFNYGNATIATKGLNRDELVQKMEQVAPYKDKVPGATQSAEYRGLHTAPMKDSGSPLHDLKDTYPDDIYSNMAAQYYGHYGQNNPMDRESVNIVQRMRNHPDRQVRIYRAIPKDVKEGIDAGDWVTINRMYAKEHGESQLDGKYRIISKQVQARDIFTNGDSIHEWGYDPQPYTPIAEKAKEHLPGWYKKKMGIK